MNAIRVASAPVSYGVFELTVDDPGALPDPEAVLDAMSRGGYGATELGPLGYLGDATTLPARLERFGLDLAGGYVPLRFTQREHWEEDLAVVAATLDMFSAAEARDARLVLADAGSQARRASAGRASARGLGLGDADWQLLAGGVAQAAEHARQRGFEPTFHHHVGTYVEAVCEIERLLDSTDVGLALDTGHLALAGGDPVQALRDWGSRVDHVHLKDVRISLLAQARGLDALWRQGVFCELGAGDAALAAFLSELQASGYAGWLVVEQDRVLRPDEGLADAAASQATNRRWLEEHAGL